MIRNIVFAVIIATFAGGAAFAQETCESKAVGKDGKALAGAAKTSFMKKCMADSCATKAVSSEGQATLGCGEKQLHGEMRKGRVRPPQTDIRGPPRWGRLLCF